LPIVPTAKAKAAGVELGDYVRGILQADALHSAHPPQGLPAIAPGAYRRARGSLRGTGALKALLDERQRERET